MLRTINKCITYNYIYYLIPFLACLVGMFIILDFGSLQLLVNSIYQSVFSVFIIFGLSTTFPSFTKLIYYSSKVSEAVEKLDIGATAVENFGGLGGGKSSSGLFQGLISAEKLAVKCTTLYNYTKANYDRWKKYAPHKIKNFKQLEKSVLFWEEHPEYIPFFASTIDVILPNGQKAFILTYEHLSQQEWLPYCFFVCDEAGLLLPQDEWRSRPACMVLMCRFLRQFGYGGIFCEQKQDGIIINARKVMNSTYLCLLQRNALRPHLLLDIISKLKELLPRLSNQKLMGLVIEKLQNFADCIGFRFWERVYFKSMDFQQYLPPVIETIVCTNKLPFWYDENAYSQLYLAKDLPEKTSSYPEGFITPDSEIGKLMLRTYYEEVEKIKDKERTAEVKAKALEVRMQTLSLKEQQNEAKAKALAVKMKKAEQRNAPPPE